MTGLPANDGSEQAPTRENGSRTMLIDAHVHLYPVFDRVRFFAATVENLGSAARALGHPPGPGGIFLTETTRDDAFAELAAGKGVPHGWRVERPAQDDCALWLHGPAGPALLVVAGRQLVSAEGLEVLAIGRQGAQADRLPAADILAALRAEETPAILPWGAGKWMGARGKLLARLVEDAAGQGVLLGDNAGRPLGWPTPPAFRSGLPVLPGTDPLPVAPAVGEAGSYGFVLEGTPDPARPAEDIRARLLAMTAPPARFGGRTGPAGFVRRQIQLRAG
jgi:hypothetical protein